MDLFESFHLVYAWAEGSLPPPGYYEYRIEIENRDGKIIFLPDYPQHNPPRWIETFPCTEEALTYLYEKIVAVRIFTKQWKAARQFHIGGSTQSLIICAGGKTTKIPYDLNSSGQKILQPVFEAVKEIVPRSIWERMEALRDIYIQEQSV
jgi:hypothetical protein